MNKRSGGRSKKADPLGPWRIWTDLWTQQTETAVASAEVIARRSMMMMTGSMTTEEAMRMVTEKHTAFSRGIEAAALALASGATPEHALYDATKPVAVRVRSNARRLRG
ncbi:MAG: hypothetical protein CML43_00405 [Rhodobacteraceae bacterium]|nr:hypothetical protein [Paracoccaceae bacterium]